MRELVEIIKGIGIEGAKEVEEKVDRQFYALQYLFRHQDPEMFIKLVIANSLVSYQLTGRGEDWWWEFARYFSGREVDSIWKAYGEFLPKSKNNRRLIEAKLNRIRKVEGFLSTLTLKDLEGYYKNMKMLWKALIKIMGSREDSKTIVFTVKMFGYASRIAFSRFIPYPMEIPIPEDLRIKSVTSKLTQEKPTKFWMKIGQESGVPPLHIDSLIWPLLGNADLTPLDIELRNKLMKLTELLGL
ncbi:N-glycosylase [Pyrococcus furiosus DSM 3638]|uniref:N-glycosylase/DNA lyase n=3 Tax=Pyrococcus furiosus TaxID=2261 RepID=AGOG_PYRFU|nr:N-glycosylase/DNA lyase [Pyrococcus furiosus]Q8U2D5.1 RecName: Full=N-glycosylase/DNA lyase; AltName: Full=8-oxoguanine DNA glycosylase; AltName: Full=AGOG; AltName: Full=DNA-(apurinic or apyrimidinic site) lyase; Short=AP lyase [Pyrococcus furiosus DSM 3638]AAL81028.1 hypothetical protein PF0904 [Pyrococcus furiosus DSM 3638]AFN03697.1 N-glycosylase/DNA lyase [Pyrococcus furiosus COM1]QEK78573.1 N-glycosylase [Pyrococcus furiosus DSM 3638]